MAAVFASIDKPAESSSMGMLTRMGVMLGPEEAMPK
jgi:hypothetical protein